MLAAARLFFAALALVAIGRQLFLHVQGGYDTLNFFSYFTNLSNLFASAVFLLCARAGSPSNAALRDTLRFVSVVNMTVVGLVFAVLLRNVDLGALLPWVNVVLHYVMPCVVVIDWLWQPPASRLTLRHLGLVLVIPAAYLVYALLRGAHIGWYPYPFLNPANVGGYAGVAVYAVGIAVTVLAAGAALLWAGNRGRSRQALAA
jgi:hypothetical protein